MSLEQTLESLRGCDGVRAEMHAILQFFRYAHLPSHLQPASKVLADAALAIAAGPRNPQTVKALEFLLLSKDAAVRAHLFDAGA